MVFGPAIRLVTGTVTVQELLIAMVAPDILTVPVPMVAVILGLPVQVVLAAPEMVTPVGSVSLKVAPVSATVVFGLVSVKVRVDVPPTPIVGCTNALVKVGAVGIPQPVKVTPSINTECPLLSRLELNGYKRKTVLPLGLSPVLRVIGPKVNHVAGAVTNKVPDAVSIPVVP